MQYEESQMIHDLQMIENSENCEHHSGNQKEL